MPNAAVIVGHTPVSPGAVSIGGTAEFPYCDNIAGRVLSLLGTHPGVSAQRVYRGLPDQYGALPAKVNAVRFPDGRPADVAIELHFNAAVSMRARGCEMLYWHTSAKGKRLAALLQEETLRVIRTHDRGLKPLTTRDRGARLLRETAMPTVICEPFFGSSPDDWTLAVHAHASLAAAYTRALLRYFGLPVAAPAPACVLPTERTGGE